MAKGASTNMVVYNKKWLNILSMKRNRALKEYKTACKSYLNALKATDDELDQAANFAADQLSEYKPSDFVDSVICWEHYVADTLEELRTNGMLEKPVEAKQVEKFLEPKPKSKKEAKEL
jgi:hypothetical protein